LPEEFRLQRLVFKAAEKAVGETERTFTGSRVYLLGQLIRLVEEFLASDRLELMSLYHREDLRRRILIALSLDRIAQHLVRFVNQENAERIELVFDEQQPIGSTGYSRTWYTTRQTRPTQKSQISDLIVDSAWEAYAAEQFEMSDLVHAHAKNERLGFQIQYLWNGSRRRFIPDFLVRLANGKTLVLEIKGVDSEQNKAKRDAMELWVRGVNAHGGFGVWCWDVAFRWHRSGTSLRGMPLGKRPPKVALCPEPYSPAGPHRS
jgi:type III restriction enzyme